MKIVEENETPFEVILTDLSMPIMNGYEATQRIRKIETERDYVPARIYAISGHVMDEHAEACEENNFNGLTAKPVTD